MAPLEDLERYLTTARVVEVAAFPWGGAHPDKCLAIPEGRAALLCKPAPPGNSDARWLTSGPSSITSARWSRSRLCPQPR